MVHTFAVRFVAIQHVYIVPKLPPTWRYIIVVTAAIFSQILPAMLAVCAAVLQDQGSLDPDMRMLNSLHNIVTQRPSSSHHLSTTNDFHHMPSSAHPNTPTIAYKIRGNATLIDNWTGPCYFTAAFPTLFPAGIGGHLDERDTPVSLSAFAEWALHHHSRRFARHRTFMYVIYDVLQLRKSSVSNKMLIKRQHWNAATDNIASLTLGQLQDAAKALSTGQRVDDPVIRRLQRNLITIGTHARLFRPEAPCRCPYQIVPKPLPSILRFACRYWLFLQVH
ncbi:hypothetical protein AWENTII_003161 [Aspergillus wentii]